MFKIDYKLHDFGYRGIAEVENVTTSTTSTTLSTSDKNGWWKRFRIRLVGVAVILASDAPITSLFKYWGSYYGMANWWMIGAIEFSNKSENVSESIRQKYISRNNNV